MSINTWTKANTHPLLQIKQFLTECEYKPEYDGFPLRPIQKLLNGAEAEIRRLQLEVDMLKKQIKTPPPEDKKQLDKASQAV